MELIIILLIFVYIFSLYIIRKYIKYLKKINKKYDNKITKVHNFICKHHQYNEKDICITDARAIKKILEEE